MSFEFKPGSLVMLRDRPWMVLPSDDPELLLLKPLGGSDDEITGIYKPLGNLLDIPESYHFSLPDEEQPGDIAVARLLFQASQLSFRNAAGPFRCLGKLSFRPRSYQITPLVMALRQSIVRMLIADDVGIGKTIEALLIARELHERREIFRLAVVCPPHLCDQWQAELQSKFGIEAVIVRSGTITALERRIRPYETIFRAFPFQIISIDTIKTGDKRQVFIDHAPELIIVDEAHTCARPSGVNSSQQLRHFLLRDIARKPTQHLIMLTATPHSGKRDEFQSLLGLLKPEFEKLDPMTASQTRRRELSQYYIQRRRADVIKSLDQETPFPVRRSIDIGYELGSDYEKLFRDILEYARRIATSARDDGRDRRYSYWAALTLLRGVMSSPAAGIMMLEKKAGRKSDQMIPPKTKTPSTEFPETIESANDDTIQDAILDSDSTMDDSLLPLEPFYSSTPGYREIQQLLEFAARMKDLAGPDQDHKLAAAISQIRDFINHDLNPVVFCRFIQTADYLGDHVRQAFKSGIYRSIRIEVITSEQNDELRREIIDSMKHSPRRILIATDCLSEGINLQDAFNAVLHYDLPWNPNRLEQREGRIDRYGQTSAEVETALLYGNNNPIDGVVLKVLLDKAREIRKSTGVTVPMPENSPTVMEAITHAVLLKPSEVQFTDSRQLSLFDEQERENAELRIAKALEEAGRREIQSRSIFARNAIKIEEIEQDLVEVDHAIGTVQTVEDFTLAALRFERVKIKPIRDGYRIDPTNLPERLRGFFPRQPEPLITFKSPTPAGYYYLGRNHPLVETLSQSILNMAIHGDRAELTRSAVLRTRDVVRKTVLLQLRVRNVIADCSGGGEIVAEEMWIWGYTGDLNARNYIEGEPARQLLFTARASQNMERLEQIYWLKEEMKWIRDEVRFRAITDPVALERAAYLVNAHTRFRKLVADRHYRIVEPVLPMDIIGIYILLPEVNPGL